MKFLATFRGSLNPVIFLSLLAGILTSIYVTLDYIILQENEIMRDPIVYGFIAVIIGFIISSVIILCGSIRIPKKNRKIGSYLDPHFTGINIPSRKALKYILLSSVLNVFATILYLIACSVLDPSIVISLMQFVIIYLIIADLFLDKELPVIIEIQALVMVIIGGVLVTINSNTSFGSIVQIIGIILVIGPLNIASMLMSYFQKRTRLTPSKMTSKTDAITIRFWTTSVLLVIFSTLMLLFKSNTIFQLFNIELFVGFFLIFCSMLIFTVYYILYIRAIESGKLSIVNALLAISIVLSIPLTFFTQIIFFGNTGTNLNNPIIWILKILGAILVFIGIIALSISEIRFYIFFKKKVPFPMENILQELVKIKGVQKVVCCTGKHDGIIHVKTRSIGKSYNQIIKKIEQIEGISSINSTIIFKDWESLDHLRKRTS